MKNKYAIITGADGGMGTEETRAVAEAGYHVIMACYCPKKAQTVCDQLKAETGNPNIEVIGIDLANLASVRAFADEVKARLSTTASTTATTATVSTATVPDVSSPGSPSPLSLLMNNAGTMETGRHITVDGLERTVSVNYVGPYLLTRLLLPLMGEGSRIVNMASCVYCLGHLDFPHFFERGRKGSFWRIPIYSNTKLAITLFTIALAERVKDRSITVNAADPGVVNTEIIRMQMFFDPLTDLVFRPFIRTPRQGADTAIRLLLDEEKAGQTGHFWRTNRIINLGDKYYHHRQLQQLWDETERIVETFL